MEPKPITLLLALAGDLAHFQELRHLKHRAVVRCLGVQHEVPLQRLRDACREDALLNGVADVLGFLLGLVFFDQVLKVFDFCLAGIAMPC